MGLSFPPPWLPPLDTPERRQGWDEGATIQARIYLFKIEQGLADGRSQSSQPTWALGLEKQAGAQQRPRRFQALRQPQDVGRAGELGTLLNPTKAQASHFCFLFLH